MCDTCLPDSHSELRLSEETKQALTNILQGRVQQDLGTVLTTENLHQVAMELSFKS